MASRGSRVTPAFAVYRFGRSPICWLTATSLHFSCSVRCSSRPSTAWCPLTANGAVRSARLWDEFEKQTSRLPFAAILTGRTRFELAEFHVWQVALAVALFAGVFWLHGIIGPSPLWVLRT